MQTLSPPPSLRPSHSGGVLGRLRRDSRGNILALMAVLMVPIATLSGSAIDIGRLYTVKTRLQQACDAGVLAGRKMMTDPNAATLDATATSAAQSFFRNNFRVGFFSTTATTFSAVKTSDNQVSGTATATVPMTIMKMFGMTTRVISVTCQARYDVGDADIMFVLDTTGSMACTTANDTGSGCNAGTSSYTRPDGTTGYYAIEQTGSKLSGLRSAVLSFYDTIASNIDASAHVRYGFVTYTSTVNVGNLVYQLAPSYLTSKWYYQTRRQYGDVNYDDPDSTLYRSDSESECNARAGRTPASGYTTSGTATVATVTNYTAATKYSSSKCTVSTQTVRVSWRYGRYALDTSQYITGATVDDPSKITSATSKWQGCIEERNTTAGASTFTTTSLPDDLNPDLVPSANVDSNGVPTSSDTRWRPMWPEVVYKRGQTSHFTDNSPDSTSPLGDNSDYPSMGTASNLQSGFVTCGKPAQRLATMTRTAVSNYVNATDFKAIGGTYHDTGMIWGTRLISPTGIFAADTTAWSGHNPPNRYIVFMTDGNMAPDQRIYGMYGYETLDQRVSGGDFSNLTTYHNARFVAECAAAKARNITVFVVSFGQSLNTQLTQCASPGQAYEASDNSALTTAFQKIAQQVAMLRLSR